MLETSEAQLAALIVVIALVLAAVAGAAIVEIARDPMKLMRRLKKQRFRRS